MTACLVKAGFFILRTCGGAATHSCSVCARLTCEQHFVTQAKTCAECLSSTYNTDSNDHPRQLLTARGGVYSYREHYYWARSDLSFEFAEPGSFTESAGFDAVDAEAFDHPAEGGGIEQGPRSGDSADLFDS